VAAANTASTVTASTLLFALVAAGCATEAGSPPTTVFISDYSASAVVRYDGATGDLIDVFAAGEDDHIDRPANVRLGPDGNLYLAGFGHGDIVRFDRGGTMMGVFFQDTRVLEEPVELLFHGEELVILGNDTQNAIVLASDGSLRRSFGYPTMRAGHDFAFGPDGLLYVATELHPTLGTAIQVWDLATGSLVRSFGALEFATSLAFDHHGTLYVTDLFAGRVERFDPTTGQHVDTLIENLDLPVSLDFGFDGKLYVLDDAGIQRFDEGRADGMLVPFAAPLRRPRGFTFVEN
jgi:sugar lactone lactonase YvrE